MTLPSLVKIIKMRSLKEVAEPFEPLRIAFLLRHATHEDVNRPSTLIPLILGLHPQRLPQLIFRDGSRLVNLVSEDDDGHFFKFRHVQNTLQFDPALLESLGVRRIDEIDDAINVRDVVSPGFACGLVPTEIPSLEGDLTHSKLFRVGLLCGVHLLHDVFFQS